MTFADPRRRDLAKIHLARKQLGLDEVQYRALIEAAGSPTGSSADLDAAGLARALEQMRRLGWKPVSSAAGQLAPNRKLTPMLGNARRPAPAADKQPLVRRIRAQLISLGRKPDSYADAIAKQMFGDHAPQFFEWLDPHDMLKVSQALEYEQIKQGARRA